MMSHRNKGKKTSKDKKWGFHKIGDKNHYAVWALRYFKRTKYSLCKLCLRSVFYDNCSTHDKNNFNLNSNLINFSRNFSFFHVNLKG